MRNNLYTSWRDEVAQSIYPFAGLYTPKLYDGSDLPDGVLLDALLHAANSDGGYYLESMTLESNGLIQFNVYDYSRLPVATGVWSSNLPDTSTVPLVGVGGTSAGVLVVGADALLSFFNQQEEGNLIFDADTTRFAPSTWLYARQEIADTDVTDGVPVSSEGDVYLVGANGVRLECEDNVVTINAIGDPLAKRKECGETFSPPRYITSVVYQNGDVTKECTPGDYGEAHLLADSPVEGFEPALRIVNQPRKIQLGLFAP